MAESSSSLTDALEQAHVLHHVKLKLPLLTKIGSILMTDIRSNDQVDVEKTRYRFFRQCSLLILGLGFQSLPTQNLEKSTFTAMLAKGARLLSPKSFPEFRSLFHVLLWLVENHWKHPTLARVLTGAEVDEAAANAWPEATIPELLKLRVEILASADCEVYALNLCRWCSKLPALSTEVSVYTVYFRLLHKLDQMDEFTNLCKNMRCCFGLRVIEASVAYEYVMVLVQTFLSIDWLKPTTYCCTKKLLHHWMQVEWTAAPEHTQFLASVACLTKRAVNSWQAVSLVETMYGLVDLQPFYRPFYMCTLVAALRTDHADLVKASGDAARCEQTTARLVYCCLVLATTSSTWSNCIRRAAMVTAFSLSRRLDAYYAVKEVYSNNFDGDVNDVSLCVGEYLVAEVLTALSGLRECYLNPELNWATLQAMCLYHLYGSNTRPATECNFTESLDKTQQDKDVVSTLPADGQQVKPGLLLHLLTRAQPNATHPRTSVVSSTNNNGEIIIEAEQGREPKEVASTSRSSGKRGCSLCEVSPKVARTVKISIVDITQNQATSTSLEQSTESAETVSLASKEDAQIDGLVNYQASYVAYVGHKKCFTPPPVMGPVPSWEVRVPESFHWRRHKGSNCGTTKGQLRHYKCKKERDCPKFLHQVTSQPKAKHPSKPKVIHPAVTRSRHHVQHTIGRNALFPYQMALEKEMKNTKVDEMRHKCGLCSITCEFNLLMVKHLWETHKVRLKRLPSYKKAAICDLCGQIYVQHMCMLKHMRDHETIMDDTLSSAACEFDCEDTRLETMCATNTHKLVSAVAKCT